MSVSAWLQAAIKEFGGHEDVVGMNLQAVVDAAAQLTKDIVALKEGCKGWKCGISLEGPLTKLTAAREAVSATLHSMSRYEVVFTGLRAKASVAVALEKKQFEDVRDSISKAMRATGVPAALAKAIAEFYLQGLSKSGHPEASYELTGATLDPEAFNRVLLFPWRDFPDQNETPMHPLLRTFWSTNLGMAQNKVTEKVKLMVEKGANDYHVSLGTEAFKFSPENCDVFTGPS